MAVFSSPSQRANSASASSSGLPVKAITIRRDRSTSLPLVARRSTIRFPYVLPSSTMLAVLSMFNTILVAVPAFSRVDPLMTSGPTMGVIVRSAQPARAASRLQLSPMR